jgi:hypothetical protein
MRHTPVNMTRLCRPKVMSALVALAAVVAATTSGPAVASGGSRVRAPTAHERQAIARSLLQLWKYESRNSRAFRPTLMKVRVLRSDPAYASAVVALKARSGRRRGPWMVVLNRHLVHAFGGSWPVVVGPSMDFPLSCTRVTDARVRALLCPSPWKVINYPRPAFHEQTTSDQPLPSSDLHLVDWRKVLLPGAACGSSRPISARRQDRYGATAFVDGDVNFPWWNTVVVWWSRHPAFGDLDGDGLDEAALDVACSNDGGTAGGQLHFSAVVFKADGAQLRALGVIPVEQPLIRAGHVPVGDVARIGSDGVLMRENWYGPFDTTAGGSGESVVTWRYQDGRFVRTNTRILVPVWRSAVDIADVIGRPGHHELWRWPLGHVNKMPLTRDLRFDLVFVNQNRRAKRNVGITVTIDQAPSPIVRRLKIRRLKGWAQKTLHIRHLEEVRPGAAAVIVDIHQPGAHPKRFRVKFTRG